MDQTVGISSDSVAPAAFTAFVDPVGTLGVAVSPTSGNTPATLTVSVNPTTLDLSSSNIPVPLQPGFYEVFILVEVAGQGNLSIPVFLNILNASGTEAYQSIAGSWQLTAGYGPHGKIAGTLFTATAQVMQMGTPTLVEIPPPLNQGALPAFEMQVNVSGQFQFTFSPGSLTPLGSPCVTAAQFGGTLTLASEILSSGGVGELPYAEYPFTVRLFLTENGRQMYFFGGLSKDGNSISGTYTTLTGAYGCSGGQAYPQGNWIAKRLPSPTILPAPAFLSFAYQIGGAAPPAQTVTLSGSSPVAFSVTSAGADWLSVTPSQGTTPANLVVSVNPTGLGPGTRNGSIIVNAPSVTSSPQTISVAFSVTAEPVIVSVKSFLVRTIAGGYVPGGGASGDGGLALQAQLFDPVSVAADGVGNVFIADQNNNRIRKVAPTGVITTFAGTGVQGSGGDGEPAISAQLTYPQAVAVDTIGRVYVGDCNGTGNSTPPNNRVRVVDASGVITTLVSGFACVIALAVDNVNNVYVSGSQVTGSDGIFRVSQTGTVTRIAGIGGARGFGGDGGPAINAEFNVNFGIAIDNQSGILYVADEDNHRVRAIYPTGIIQTVAGIGIQGFSGDGGPGTSAQLSYPSGVAVDKAGNLYIADSGNARIRMLTPTGLISTIGGNGLPDDGAIAFTLNNGILYPGKGDGGPALLGSMSPGTIATDANGDVYFAESNGSGNSVRALIPSASTVGCMYSVVPSQVNFSTAGGSSSVSLTAAQNSCPWLAFSTTDWASVTSGTTGSGNASVSITAAANVKSATRSAIVAVAGQVVTISQPGAACVLAASVLQVSAPAAGLSGTVSVTANLPDCPWSASTNAPWLFIINGSMGQGSGIVSYSVAANSGPSRIGTLTIAGQTVTFTQAAASGVISTTISFIGSAATGTSPFTAGQLVSIYGTQLGPPTASSAEIGPDGAVSKSNGGTQVLFDGVAAPILYTGANQVNTAIPCSVAGRSSTQMVVQYLGAQSAPFTVPLGSAAPGFFTANGSGSGQGAVLNQDDSLNGPGNPAPRGSAIAIYATGVPTSPCIDGQIYESDFPKATLPVIVGVGNIGAQVLYAGQAPDLISGVAQINILIPNDAPTGVVQLTLLVGGVFSPPGVTIAVK